MKTVTNNTYKSRIIAIDDSPMILTFLQSYLEKTYDVTTYRSTSKALRDLSQGAIVPDCILTDFNLGESDLNGLEFIKQLKVFDPNTPVLVLCGQVDIHQKISCLQSGAVDFVSKPFNPMELEVRLKNVLSVSKQLSFYQDAI